MVSCSDLRIGDVIRIDGQLCKVIEMQHVKPGKGGAFFQCEFKVLPDMHKKEMRLRTDEAVDKIDVFLSESMFLYNNGDIYTFFDHNTQNQIEVMKDQINNVEFLVENMEVQLVLTSEDQLLDIILPRKVQIEVISAPGYIKGQSATSQDKVVELSNGVKIKAPQYVVSGDIVEVNLDDISFVRRIQK